MAGYNYNSIFKFMIIVLTEHIVEVREVQNSDGFDRYPYEEKKEQSLSLLVEGEIQGKSYYNYTMLVISNYILLNEIFLAGPAGSNKYAVLQSLDLVCDSAEEKRLWCHAVCNKYMYCYKF